MKASVQHIPTPCCPERCRPKLEWLGTVSFDGSAHIVEDLWLRSEAVDATEPLIWNGRGGVSTRNAGSLSKSAASGGRSGLGRGSGDRTGIPNVARSHRRSRESRVVCSRGGYPSLPEEYPRSTVTVCEVLRDYTKSFNTERVFLRDETKR